MPILVSNLGMPLDGDENVLIRSALARAGVTEPEVAGVEIVRKSLDRRRGRLGFSYTLRIALHDEPRLLERLRANPSVRLVEEEAPPEVHEGEERLETPPVVIGSGPGGLFAALLLARRGLRPVVLERGDAMNARATRIRDLNRDGILDPESNYLFGEGGAGTWSDGKLTSRSKDPRSRVVLQEFREKSGLDSIAYDFRPHLGSDRIRIVTGRLRQEILELGGTFRFRCCATRLEPDEPRGVRIATTAGEILAPAVVLAPGHSARDFARQLHRDGFAMERKPFQFGFRIEHPQPFIDRAVWREAAGHEKLGPADYQLVTQVGGASVFSFCMCPGGEVIPAVSDLGHMNTNGMSYSGKDSGFANSGLVVTIEPGDLEGEGVFAGVEMQERYEAAAAALCGRTVRVPGQRLSDFLEGRPSGDLPPGSCRTGMVACDLGGVAPARVADLVRGAIRRFDRHIRGFVHRDAVVVGPEARSSSPIRIVRDRTTLASPKSPRVYPVGEGAGFAGGIVSAAIDGVRAAEQILARFRWSVPAS
jgi:uncharacterized FAD-dependent dehydrogenase